MADSTLTEADRDAYRRLVSEGAWVPTEPPSCLLFKGNDTLDWLQGQVSNDMRGFEIGQTRQACFLTATGHLLSMAAFARFTDCVVATTPSESADFVLQRVENSVFMEDVAVERWDCRLTMVQGPRATELIAGVGFAPEGDTVRFERDCRGYRLSGTIDSWLLWDHGDSKMIDALRATLAPATAAAARALRLELGIPIWGQDASERTLLPELGPHFVAQHVSYAKGCYTGQEVLMRIHSRGHTNRTWVALQCEAPVEPGLAVASENRDQAGTITSAAISPEFGPLAAAMLHNDSAMAGATVTVRTEPPVAAIVQPMPLRG